MWKLQCKLWLWLWLLLHWSIIMALAANSTAPTSSPLIPVASPKASPSSISSPAPSPSSVAAAALNSSQIDALNSLQVNYSKTNPCKTPKDVLLCDNGSPTRQLIALHLANCRPSAKLSTAALLNLSSLQALSFQDCPMQPVHVPSVLISSLTSFSCIASLGRTEEDEGASKLSGVWLSAFTNVVDFTVTDVVVSVSGVNVITQGLQSVTQLTISRVNVSGPLPKNTWPSGVEYIDLSENSISGGIPSQMQSLTSLKHLDLSSNQLNGVIPNIFGELKSLQFVDLAGNELSGPIPTSITLLPNCSHLDLSHNKLNGSLLANFSSMKALRYLDISDNDITGQIPFTSSFLSRLTTLKLSGNSGLCYNHTALKSKLLTGIPNCSTGSSNDLFQPVSAPAASEVSASSSKGGFHLSKGAIVGIAAVVIVVVGALFCWMKRCCRAK